MTALLKAFQQFWRENSHIWREKFQYKEAAPHLVLKTFLQRVVNGGGRMDLCVAIAGRRFPLELKLHSLTDTRIKGIVQLTGYMNTLGLDTGWLIIFKQDASLDWDQKISLEEMQYEGKTIHVVGC